MLSAVGCLLVLPGIGMARPISAAAAVSPLALGTPRAAGVGLRFVGGPASDAPRRTWDTDGGDTE
jgi:hypothetical protein